MDMFVKTLSFVLLVGVAAISLSETSVASERYSSGFSKYLRQRDHKAFVIAPNGTWGSAWGQVSAKAAVALAMSNCRKRNRKYRLEDSCYLIHQNDRFVVKNGAKIMSARMAMPVILEIYDGPSGKLQKSRGYVYPDFRHGQTRERRRSISVVVNGGGKLCEGHYSAKGNARFAYNMVCFGKFTFKGSATGKGWKKFGYFAAPEMDLKITHKKSYIRLKTQ